MRTSKTINANILSNAIGSEKKTAQMIDEAKHQKINILPPNINYSHWFYTKKSL
jgi:DNA polymerase-3 subunit alpha